MPAVEADNGADERELASYELAFHVLPTIAEGEVPTVFQKLKDIITKHGGEITVEEEPARFDLAYDIVKYLEGRNRKFSSAYFGWVRFKTESSEIAGLNEELEGQKELLRHLLVKLSKVEEEYPFFFHEALEEQKIKTVDLGEETKEKSSKTAPEEDEENTEEVAEKEESVEDGAKVADKV